MTINKSVIRILFNIYFHVYDNQAGLSIKVFISYTKGAISLLNESSFAYHYTYTGAEIFQKTKQKNRFAAAAPLIFWCTTTTTTTTITTTETTTRTTLHSRSDPHSYLNPKYYSTTTIHPTTVHNEAAVFYCAPVGAESGW